MDVINRSILKQLLEERGEHLVSLYMPTHPYGREQKQDPIRFNNLVSEIKNQLSARGMGRRAIKQYLNQLDALQLSMHFWLYQSCGLAIFLSENTLRILRVPIEFKELTYVGDHFQIGALIPALCKGQHFYILALSQSEIRLFEATRGDIAEMDLSDLPTSLEQALIADDTAPQIQFRSTKQFPGGKGGDGALYHGHGAISDQYKTNIQRFFHKVDAGIMDLLAGESAPLVLSGVGFLLPIYRQASTYPNITDKVIEGNPEEKSAQTLHKEAWEIIDPLFQQDRQGAIQRSQMMLGTGSDLVSTSLEAIVPASFFGRVETLFIPSQKQIWGTLDEKSKSFDLHETFKPGDVDLLNLCAAETLINSGDVYVLDPSEMPQGADIVAIFRYAANLDIN